LGIRLIEKIRLQNWKTHSDSSFEFEKGTNVLVGQMGAGKSSVMDAICFALFGTFPGLQARRISLEEVIMNKPIEAETTTIELQFGHGGKSYKVERKIKRKGSTEAKIWLDNKLIAGPKPRDVNQAVEKAIEINYNLFSRAVYSEQNEIDYFLRLTPKDRKSKFDELLDLQKYENVRSNAVTAMNRLKTIAKDKSGWVAEQKAGLSKEEESKLGKRIEEKEKENKELEAGLGKKEKEGKELEKEVKELEETEKVFRNLKESISKNKAVMQELERNLKEIREKAKPEAELEKEKESASKELRGIEKSLEEARSIEEKERKKKTEFGKEAALNQRQAEDLNKHLEELQGLGAECPTCKQNLEEKTRAALIEEAGAKVKKVAIEMEKALKQEAEANSGIAKAKETLEKGMQKKDILKEKEMKISQLLEAVKKSKEKENQFKMLEKETKELDEKLGKTKFDEKKLIEKRKNAIETKAGIEAGKRSIEANNQLVKEIRTSLERIEKTRKQIKELEEKIKAVEASIEKMNYFVNSLLATQSELRTMLISTINEAMQDIWQRIYPYKDYVSAKMDVSEGSYELKARERSGNWVRVEGILSGGERSAAAICIRIAFSLVLTRNLSWLILDEPTHNLDSKAIETLGRMMQMHLPLIVDQIFVITHDLEMKKAASASLYVLEREKNEDAVTSPVKVMLEN